MPGIGFASLMVEPDQLQAQAQKCRMLAGGLSNRDDVRALEDLARELEERAQRLRRAAPLPPADIAA
jgi:hypothetical protein